MISPIPPPRAGGFFYYLNNFENQPNKLGTLPLLSSLVCLKIGLLYPTLYLIFCLTALVITYLQN